MTPTELLRDIQNQFRAATRQWDADNDLESLNIVRQPQHDAHGNEFNPNLWIDTCGVIYAGFFTFTRMRETYTVIFRQCPLSMEDKPDKFAEALSLAATKIENSMILESKIN